MTPDQAAAAIRSSAGRFFTCTFVKLDGSVREMSARWCVARPVKEHREREGCLTVFDDLEQGWRTIRIDRLTAICIDGQREEVTL
jgi:WYL_2, Sm-like SH3 beta-barrel fold